MAPVMSSPVLSRMKAPLLGLCSSIKPNQTWTNQFGPLRTLEHKNGGSEPRRHELLELAPETRIQSVTEANLKSDFEGIEREGLLLLLGMG